MNNACVISFIFISDSQYFGEKQTFNKYSLKVMKKDHNEQVNN